MRLPDAPQPGMILCYSYLWADESPRGQVEGRKDRPTVIVLARRDLGPAQVVYVVPITHDPGPPGEAVELPAVVKRHLGLDDAASYIKTTEMNVFVWPGPDLRPIRRSSGDDDAPCCFGFLPRGLFRSLKESIARNQRLGTVRTVKR